MKKEKIIHLELGAAHGDIVTWMRSLPNRTLNQTVNEILSAESRGKIARIPHEFSSAKEEQSLSCRLVIRDGAALDFVAKIPRGEIKTTIVKIIRKHIRKNREMPKEPIGIRRDLLLDVLQGFRTKMDAKEAEYAGIPNKYSKLCECYDKAHNALFQAILNCANAGDENQCDLMMRQIDYVGIVDSAFEEVFELIHKSADENQPVIEAEVLEPAAKTIFVPNEGISVWDDYYEEDD